MLGAMEPSTWEQSPILRSNCSVSFFRPLFFPWA
jgi:hypothetical protein